MNKIEDKTTKKEKDWVYTLARERTLAEGYQEEISFLEMFKQRNLDNIKQFSPTRFEEDKLYNQGMDDICKEQNKVIDKRIEELKQKLGELKT